ncbi:MAG: transposase [Gemmatimonadales bacterium]
MARELAIRPEQLRAWKRQLLADGVIAPPVRVESADEELRRVKRELEGVRQERDLAMIHLQTPEYWGE